MTAATPVPNAGRSIQFLSVVAPAHNEQENIDPLIDQIVAALEPLDVAFEIIIVDDGSTDATLERLRSRQTNCSRLRVLTMRNTPPGRGNGQSAAFHAGFHAARGDGIVVLDADLQNDPADIPHLLEVMASTGADFVQGDRSRTRRDNLVRRVTSLVGRTARRWLLGDSIRDTGCSLRLMRREIALAIPLQFRGMHRFIPVTARQLGYVVVETPVNHRPRIAGQAKYGIWNRALPGLIDCLAVRWMRSRRRPVGAEEVSGSTDDGERSIDSAAAVEMHIAPHHQEEIKT